MSTKFDNKTALLNLIEKMDSSDINLMYAFATGYETGKTTLQLANPVDTQVQNLADSLK